MNAMKLTEALDIVNDICLDVEGNYPVGSLRVRRLLGEVLATDGSVDEEVVYLGCEPPPPAA
jgi:hypothetical protein